MKTVRKNPGLLSSCFGNLFEHYDTALFGLLSPFIASFIFPEKEPLTALILTYAMIPLGMIARPFGSLFFGYIGDVHGRGKALFLTLAGMGIISGAIAFSPTYTQAGILAPLIFCIGRILQNFFSSGETMGGAIFLLENTSEKKHDLLSSCYNASTIGGILLASAGVSVLSRYNMVESGWRLLYLLGSVTAIFGCLVRRKVPFIPTSEKPPIFSETLAHLFKVFWEQKKALGSIMIISGFSYATYSIALVFLNGFIPLISSLTKAQMLSLNTSLLIIDFCALPFFGFLSSKISREKMMMISSLSIILTALPLLYLLQGASLIQALGVRICFVLLGVAFSAPFHAWAQNLVPAANRYAIISLGYALGSQLLGSPTAVISLWLFKTTGNVLSVSWYWILLAFASSLVMIFSFKKSRIAETIS